jgi:predicted outer membrane protein
MRFLIAIAALMALTSAAHAQQAEKQPLDHSAYDVWQGIDDEALSHDGRWLLYSLTLQAGA